MMNKEDVDRECDCNIQAAVEMAKSVRSQVDSILRNAFTSVDVILNKFVESLGCNTGKTQTAFPEISEHLPAGGDGSANRNQMAGDVSFDSLLKYQPAITSLCEKLSFQELKSLSLVSKNWWEVSSSFVVNRACIAVTLESNDQIQFLRKYKHVRISEVSLYDVISRLPDSVESLQLRGIRIQSRNFKQLETLKKLRNLDFHICDFPEESPSAIDLELGLRSLSLKNYQYMHLNNDLNLFQALFRANDSIQILKLHLPISTAKLDNFMNNVQLTKLKEFSIEGGYCQAIGFIQFLQNNRNIEVCSIKEFKVDDQVIRVLRQNCEDLKRLSLSECDCVESSANILNELKMMKKLRHLDISDTGFEANDLRKFNPRQLESLYMSRTSLSLMDARSMLQSMGNMKILELSYSWNLDSSILPFIAEQMPNLESLKMTKLRHSFTCDNVGNSVNNSDLKFGRLETLSLSWTKSTDQLLRLFNAPRLRTLDTEYSNIGSEGIRHIAEKSPLLEVFILGHNETIKSDMEYIAVHLPCIRRLKCKMSGEGVKILIANTWIESCGIGMPDKDRLAIKEWITRFEPFKLKDFGTHGTLFTNGARTIRSWPLSFE